MIELVLPYPPSVNSYWRHPTRGALAGRHLISEKGRQYRQALEALAAEHRWPKLGSARLQVHIEAWMPDKRRRDLDNVLKAALDGLAHAGLFDDDSQIDRLSIERAPLVGGMLKVSVQTMEARREQ